MRRHEALRILGLEDGADEAAIRAAYTRVLRSAHPDTGDFVGNMPLVLRRAKTARDLLLSEYSGKIATCKICGGVGSMRNVACPACGGKGRMR